MLCDYFWTILKLKLTSLDLLGILGYSMCESHDKTKLKYELLARVQPSDDEFKLQKNSLILFFVSTHIGIIYILLLLHQHLWKFVDMLKFWAWFLCIYFQSRKSSIQMNLSDSALLGCCFLTVSAATLWGVVWSIFFHHFKVTQSGSNLPFQLSWFPFS